MTQLSDWLKGWQDADLVAAEAARLQRARASNVQFDFVDGALLDKLVHITDWINEQYPGDMLELRICDAQAATFELRFEDGRVSRKKVEELGIRAQSLKV